MKNTNIPDHLASLQKEWEQLMLFHKHNQLISDAFFKQTVTQSLPCSWRTFTTQYVPAYVDKPDQDPKKCINSQEFIGLIKQEWELNESLKRKEDKATKQGKQTKQSNVPLAACITDPSTSHSSSHAKQHCDHCRKDNHKTSKCCFLDTLKCENCDCFHQGECWQPHAEGSNKRPRKGKGKEGSSKKKKESHNVEPGEQSNSAIEDQQVAL
jgi:hypothetical protein